MSAASAQSSLDTREAAEPAGAPTLLSPAQAVQAMLHARSITVVGASDDGMKASGRTLRYLLKYGYQGAIYPVNPRRESVQGVRAYASVADIPEAADLAVIVLPAPQVPQTIAEIGARGIRVAIVFASGFAEVGPEGAVAQRELLQVARASGVRLLGPNCVGAVGTADAVTAAFMTGLDQDRFELKDDGLGFVTQSGAMGAFILNMAQSTGLGLSHFLSTGNEADLTFSDGVQGLLADPEVSAVLGYVEGVTDPQPFRAALETAREQQVPVALMKVGRSERGAAAAQSHTGALAGSDAVYDGLFRQYGVFRADSVDHLLDLGRVLTRRPAPIGPRLAIVTLSGGAGVLMTDVAQDHGLEVPRWDDEWAARMADVLPAFASVRNPIDTTGVIAADQTVLHAAVEMCIEHPETDVVVVLLGNMEREEDAVCHALAEQAASSDTPVVVVWVGGSGRPLQLLGAHGVPVFPEPVRAVRAIAAWVEWGVRHAPAAAGAGASASRSTGAPSASSVHSTGPPVAVLDEVAAKALLGAAGVPVVRERQVEDVKGAVEAANELGLPVVVKLLSEEVVHKSDLGFVAVGLTSSQDVGEAAARIVEGAAAAGVADRRLVVQQMIDSSTELILGMNDDPVFGPVVMLGMGGVLAEISPDVQFRLPPLLAEDVRDMVAGLRGAPVLRGARGRPAIDEDALVEAVQSFAALAVKSAGQYSSIDVNPLLIDRDGRPVAVDAVVVRSEQS